MSSFWSRFFPLFYRILRGLDPVLTWVWHRTGLGNVVQVVTIGRRSGEPRATFLGVLRVGGREYLGHPNGRASWVANALANPRIEIRASDGSTRTVAAVPLPDGPERFAAIGAAFRQHPFPGGVIYWLARSHVRALGVYFRVEPAADGPSGMPVDAPPSAARDGD